MAAGCGGTDKGAAAPVTTPIAQVVFETVVPSVVAVLNDDRAMREEEMKQAMKEMGVEAHAPKQVVDVSLRKEATPNGTGFLVDSGLVVTAAHVIHAPGNLKLTTKAGQTVDADLEYIDEVRDVALLKPKTPLTGVPALRIAEANPPPGRRVWAMGHTGAGLWTLSWGVSEGITSGVVDFLNSSLLLFDAPVYPGFSGGPVIALDSDKKPIVVGVNHAILFAGGQPGLANISSAASVSEIREVLARHAPPIEAKLAEFVKQKSAEIRAEMFVTSRLSIHKDPMMLTSASIVGNERTIETGPDDFARVPVVSMLFGLQRGKHEVTFELWDPDDKVLDTKTKSVKVDHERVTFASADFRFDPAVAGRYDLVTKVGGKIVGKTDVWIEDPDDDDQPVNEQDADDVDGDPKVDVVVASFGMESPFALGGIRASWAEFRYPRRVGFTWFARGSRGWSGTNVAITAFVLDDKQKIVGRGVGCFKPELRAERNWTCAGTGGTPLVTHEGKYDVVFAINDRPIALWPMEAMVRTNQGASALDKWVKDLKSQHSLKKHAKPSPGGSGGATPPPPSPPGAGGGAKPGATPAKPAPKPGAAGKPAPKPPAKP
ncbi:MAG: trypsin-like peptidase domain-containing protein [Deltaproteobacteria bacterium]|nr:trypsin-like peptidase domain-containing protein [Deltaproteobacteria bacterium]